MKVVLVQEDIPPVSYTEQATTSRVILVTVNSNDLGMTSSSNPPPAQQQPTNRTVVVVVPSKRKLTVKSKHHPRQQQQQQQQRQRCLATPLSGAGLPSFSRAKSSAGSTTTTSTYDDDDDDTDEVDALLAELPSDTHLAIQSLQQESRGLQIPLSPSVSSNGGGKGSTGSYSIQVLLEYQILQRFSEHQRSVSDTVSELHHLVRTNQLQQLVCVGDSHTLTSSSSTTNRHDHRRRRRVAYLWTRDYVTAVRHAHYQHQQQQQNQSARAPTATNNMTTGDVTEWFLQHLSCWSGLTTISKLDFDDKWPPIVTTASTPWTVNKAIQHLLSIQVLRRDDSNSAVVVRGDDNDDERYQLWLPQWGTVCKAWNHATQQLLLALAKTPRKELSERNLLAKHHHDRHDGIIPMAFLLDDLQQEGIIQILERPFGRFVKANPPSQIWPVAATSTK
jgi:hypothetical protein